MALKILLMCCVAMQGVMLFPHHHHHGSEVPCLNIAHCREAAACCPHDEPQAGGHPGHACGGHSHDAPDGVCSLERGIVAELRSDRASHDRDSHGDLCAAALFAYFVFDTAQAERAEDTLAGLRDKERPFVEPLYLTYLTRASLLRAPTPFA